MCAWANKSAYRSFFSYAHSDLFAFIRPHPVILGKKYVIFVSIHALAHILYHTRDTSETQTISCLHYTSPVANLSHLCFPKH